MQNFRSLLLISFLFVLLVLPSLAHAEPEAGDIWTEPNTGMEFVYVPGDCYQMGGGSWVYENTAPDERPKHEVCVDGFWMGKYEVTIDQYRRYLQATNNTDGVDWTDADCPIEQDGAYSLSRNKFSQEGDQPMVEVSWHTAKAFADWLSQKTGKKFRLPTEAEWEYAARSGGKEQEYAGGDDVDSLAWYKDNSEGQTHNAGTKSPNDLGIYDMSGNVWEWCSDWYYRRYYDKSPKDNPQGESSGSYRVIRGGSWDYDVWYLRTVYRYYCDPSYMCEDVGLRLVMTKE